MGRNKDFYVGTMDCNTLKVGGSTFSATGTLALTTEVVTTTNVITAAESGKTFFLNHATGFTSTLPTPAAGLNFRFVVTTQNTSGNSVIATNGAAAILYGSADVNSTQVTCSAQKQINLVASTVAVGNWVEVISNGTNWYVSGVSTATGGITFTAP